MQLIVALPAEGGLPRVESFGCQSCGEEYTREELRQSPRHQTLQSGTIALGDGAAIDCILRDVSNNGACLEFDSSIGVPETFILVTCADNRNYSCHVAWRTARRVGVRFV
jgi:hypothetical protein